MWAPAPFGFTGELHHDDLVYLRARWYDPGSGTFTSVDPFDGFERMPYSLHPYQYAYAAPTMWTDPSGRFVDCSAYPNHPQCSIDAYDGWHETDPEQGRRDTSITVDFIPVVGDGKGFVECIAGHDLITGDPLAWWERVLGCICLKEVATTATIGGSILGAGRHADDAADAARHADEAADAADAAGSVL
jgi:RHS repeat-associated protein